MSQGGGILIWLLKLIRVRSEISSICGRSVVRHYSKLPSIRTFKWVRSRLRIMICGCWLKVRRGFDEDFDFSVRIGARRMRLPEDQATVAADRSRSTGGEYGKSDCDRESRP